MGKFVIRGYDNIFFEEVLGVEMVGRFVSVVIMIGVRGKIL